jgi:RNA polymerase sigma-70 factor (ECF subfamily)
MTRRKSNQSSPSEESGPRENQRFLEAFEEHSDALFRHALFRVSDRERAYDITQDTFLKAWDYAAGGGEVRHYKSFLYRIMHNLIIDEYRKKRALSLDEMLDDESSAPAIEARLSEGSVAETEDRLDEQALIEAVQARIPELPEHYATALTLRFVDGLSTGEIAETIGVSENVVSVRIHRGISKLRDLYTTL